MSALHIVLIIYIAGEVVLGTGILFASFSFRKQEGEDRA